MRIFFQKLLSTSSLEMKVPAASTQPNNMKGV